MITPDGETQHPRPRIDSAGEGARPGASQRLLETGECASINELAAAEKIDRSNLCRALRHERSGLASSRRQEYLWDISGWSDGVSREDGDAPIR